MYAKLESYQRVSNAVLDEAKLSKVEHCVYFIAIRSGLHVYSESVHKVIAKVLISDVYTCSHSATKRVSSQLISHHTSLPLLEHGQNQQEQCHRCNDSSEAREVKVS